MSLSKDQMKERCKRYAIDVVRFIDTLPNGIAFYAFSKQLVRCSSSVGANYRAATRAKSLADFINKLKIVEEEADESIYFLELIEAILEKDSAELIRLKNEGEEILKIIVVSIRTARSRQDRKS